MFGTLIALNALSYIIYDNDKCSCPCHVGLEFYFLFLQTSKHETYNAYICTDSGQK